MGKKEKQTKERIPAALAEDQSLSLNTHAGWLTTACVSGSRECNTLCWPQWVPTHMCASHIHKNKIDIFKRVRKYIHLPKCFIKTWHSPVSAEKHLPKFFFFLWIPVHNKTELWAGAPAAQRWHPLAVYTALKIPGESQPNKSLSFALLRSYNPLEEKVQRLKAVKGSGADKMSQPVTAPGPANQETHGWIPRTRMTVEGQNRLHTAVF